MTCPPEHKHGATSTCYNSHQCRCAPCVQHKREWRNRYEWETRRMRGQDVWIPATGTRRRRQALAVMGWSCDQIAQRIGSHHRPLMKIRQGITESTHMSMAVKIDRVYRELCMTRKTDREGKITTNRAARYGWLSPLAWDDVDRDPEPVTTEATDDIDEVAVTLACEGQRVHLTYPERRAAVQRLHTKRWGDQLIADTIRIPVRTVLRIRQQLGLQAFPYAELVKRGAA